MPAKTITIKKSVYDRLTGLKGDSESFSDLFERLADSVRPDLSKYAGIISGGEADEMKKSIVTYRAGFERSFESRRKRLGL